MPPGFDHPELSRDDPSDLGPGALRRRRGLEQGVVASASALQALRRGQGRLRGGRLGAPRAAQLPEVWAAIPMVESCYKPEVWSACCARGWWQFMPEFGPRFRDDPDVRRPRAWTSRSAADATPPISPSTSRTRPPRRVHARQQTTSTDGACNMSDCAPSTSGRTFASPHGSPCARSAWPCATPPWRRAGPSCRLRSRRTTRGTTTAHCMRASEVNKPYNLLPAYEKWWRERGSAGAHTAHVW